MIKVFFIIALIIWGCSGQKNIASKHEKKEVILLDIEEFNDVYRFKGVINRNDTIFILSGKDFLFEKRQIRSIKKDNFSAGKIKVNNIYNFDLHPLRVRVSTMEQLGQYIIVKTDTLWSGPAGVKPPAYYTFSTN